PFRLVPSPCRELSCSDDADEPTIHQNDHSSFREGWGSLGQEEGKYRDEPRTEPDDQDEEFEPAEERRLGRNRRLAAILAAGLLIGLGLASLLTPFGGLFLVVIIIALLAEAIRFF